MVVVQSVSRLVLISVRPVPRAPLSLLPVLVRLYLLARAGPRPPQLHSVSNCLLAWTPSLWAIRCLPA